MADHDRRLAVLESKVDTIESRLDMHEEDLRRHNRALSDGEVQFALFGQRLDAVTKGLGELTATIKQATLWILASVATVAGGGILWSVVQAYRSHP